MRQVDLERAPQAEGAEALDRRLAVHQHATHVGVDDQRIGLFLRVGGAGQRAALAAVLRILDRILPGDVGLPKSLNADTEARVGHYPEHPGEPIILVVDQRCYGRRLARECARTCRTSWSACL